jgi:uncharacterized protein
VTASGPRRFARAAARGLGLAGETLIAQLAPGSDAAAQARSVTEVAHRPWPPPDRPWLQGQTWRDLLFLHWPVPAATLRPAVPEAIPIDTFDGSAWLAVTPLEMRAVRPRGMPPPPRAFGEVNVRTYTTIAGRPGIWFLSLDAGSALAAAGGRLAYHLPYVRARVEIARDGERVTCVSRREGDGARLSVRYWPLGSPFTPEPGTLEYFLTERYCLYALNGSRLQRAEIHHGPWRLRVASAEIAENTMSEPLAVPVPDIPPLLHYAARQDVVVWTPETIGHA